MRGDIEWIQTSVAIIGIQRFAVAESISNSLNIGKDFG